jgi:hypothetical protein
MPTHDVDGRRIAFAGAGIAVSVALAIVAVFLLMRLWDMPARTDRARSAHVAIAAPALQDAPQLDLAQYRAEKQRLLAGGAWADAQRTNARIPIAAAMALLAQRSASAPASAASQPERQP